MRWMLVVVAVVAVTGCRKRGSEDLENPAETRAPTLLGCPDGTTEIGGPPPGTELWCARTTDTGSVLRHGPARTWWPDGRPKDAGAYADGMKIGHWWFWSAEGRLEREGDFRDDLATGWWMEYRDDGTVSEEGPMKSGGRHGSWTLYDPKTGIPTEGRWVENQKDGVWVDYDAEGRALRERVYRHGRLISQREL